MRARRRQCLLLRLGREAVLLLLDACTILFPSRREQKKRGQIVQVVVSRRQAASLETRRAAGYSRD